MCLLLLLLLPGQITACEGCAAASAVHGSALGVLVKVLLSLNLWRHSPCAKLAARQNSSRAMKDVLMAQVRSTRSRQRRNTTARLIVTGSLMISWQCSALAGSVTTALTQRPRFKPYPTVIATRALMRPANRTYKRAINYMVSQAGTDLKCTEPCTVQAVPLYCPCWGLTANGQSTRLTRNRVQHHCKGHTSLS